MTRAQARGQGVEGAALCMWESGILAPRSSLPSQRRRGGSLTQVGLWGRKASEEGGLCRDEGGGHCTLLVSTSDGHSSSGSGPCLTRPPCP